MANFNKPIGNEVVPNMGNISSMSEHTLVFRLPFDPFGSSLAVECINEPTYSTNKNTNL